MESLIRKPGAGSNNPYPGRRRVFVFKRFAGPENDYLTFHMFNVPLDVPAYPLGGKKR
jgi:hypothetical protein